MLLFRQLWNSRGIPASGLTMLRNNGGAVHWKARRRLGLWIFGSLWPGHWETPRWQEGSGNPICHWGLCFKCNHWQLSTPCKTNCCHESGLNKPGKSCHRVEYVKIYSQNAKKVTNLQLFRCSMKRFVLRHDEAQTPKFSYKAAHFFGISCLRKVQRAVPLACSSLCVVNHTSRIIYFSWLISPYYIHW